MEPVDVPLVGRDGELGRLRALLERAAEGVGQVAFVEGEAGIGKSRLLAELEPAAAVRGFRVLRGAADDLDQSRPFAALAEAMGGLPAAPEGAGADPSVRIIEAVVDTLERTAAERPVLLGLEDLHWADTSTVRALRQVALRLAHSPILTVVTLRPEPRHPELDRVMGRLAAQAEFVTLPPLDQTAVHHLTTEALAGVPGPRLLAQVQGAGGNPLFVMELLRALRDEGGLEKAGDQVEARAGPLPPTLRLTILRRLSFLPEEMLEVLRVASVLGATFSLADLSLLTGRPAVALVPLLQPAVRSGLLGEAGDELAFRHDVTREAVYSDLPVALRKGLHLQTAKALAQAGAPAARVAQHYSLGASPGDAEAVGFLREASRQAATRSAVVSVELLERAVELTDAIDPERDELSAELVRRMVAVGRLADAEPLAWQVLAHRPGPTTEFKVRWGLAMIAGARGRWGEADQHRRAAMACLPAERAAVTEPGSWIPIMGGDVVTGAAEARECLERGERLDDDFLRCGALRSLSWAACNEGRPVESVAFAEQSVAAADRSAPAAASFFPRLSLGNALTDADRLAEAAEVLRLGRRQAEERGHLAWLPYYQRGLTTLAFVAGDWDDAVVEAEAGVAVAEETETRWLCAVYGALARIALARGDLAAAGAVVGRGEQHLALNDSPSGRDIFLWGKALLLEAQGRPDEAASVAADAWRGNASSRYVLSSYRAVGPDVLRLALAAGDQALAAGVVEEAEEGARRATEVPSAQGAALRCRGLIDDDPEVLLAAVAAYRRSPRLVETAWAAEDAAVLLGRHGRAGEAAPLFEAAVATYERVGAEREVARAAAAMRELGLRRGRRRGQPRPASGWESLTPTERRVVELLPERLTNGEIGQRLFISRYTVETHLKHVFAKLGVSSRAEAAAVALRQAGRPVPGR